MQICALTESCYAVVYDVSRYQTFEALNTWIQEVELYSADGGSNIIKVLVGNKLDKGRNVAREEAERWARSHAMLFLEVSAKTREGITQVFEEVVQKILDNPVMLAKLNASKVAATGRQDLSGGTSESSTSRSCC